MIKKLPWAEILVTTLAVAAGAGVYVYAHRDEASLEESKRRGTEVVEALYAYRLQHDVYPDSLPQLVPQYVSSVEQPSWGLRRWTYRAYDADGQGGDGAAGKPQTSRGESLFQLSVAASESGYPVLYYDIVAERWVLNN